MPSPVYFVTMCVAGRRPILGSPHAAKLVLDSWAAAPGIHGWSIGRYVVMPDHVHFFARALTERKTLSEFVRDWKKWTTRQLTPLITPPVWQPEFFDHIVRSAESYEQKWQYVRENPVRAGLVQSAEDWPYAGECEALPF